MFDLRLPPQHFTSSCLYTIFRCWASIRLRPNLSCTSDDFLFRVTGDMNSEGACVPFLGRHIRRFGDSVRIRSSTHYIIGIFDLFHLSNAQGAATLGATSLRAARVVDTALDPVEHRFHRAVVGQLQHLVPNWNDLAFPVKGLARDLATPTQHSMANLMHLIR